MLGSGRIWTVTRQSWARSCFRCMIILDRWHPPPRHGLGTVFCVEQQLTHPVVTFEEETCSEGCIAVIRSTDASHDTLDLSTLTWLILTSEQKRQGEARLQHNGFVFSQEDSDVGCTELMKSMKSYY